MIIEFDCPITVAAKQNLAAKNGSKKCSVHTSKISARNAVKLNFDWQKYALAKPLTGPIKAELRFYFNAKQLSSKTKVNSNRRLNDYHWHTRIPDIDNLCKQCLDVAQAAGLIQNDKDIAHLVAYKFASEDGFSGVSVKLEELNA